MFVFEKKKRKRQPSRVIEKKKRKRQPSRVMMCLPSEGYIMKMLSAAKIGYEYTKGMCANPEGESSHSPVKSRQRQRISFVCTQSLNPYFGTRPQPQKM
jgi:hypothetical protein